MINRIIGGEIIIKRIWCTQLVCQMLITKAYIPRAYILWYAVAEPRQPEFQSFQLSLVFIWLIVFVINVIRLCRMSAFWYKTQACEIRGGSMPPILLVFICCGHAINLLWVHMVHLSTCIRFIPSARGGYTWYLSPSQWTPWIMLGDNHSMVWNISNPSSTRFGPVAV